MKQFIQVGSTDIGFNVQIKQLRHTGAQDLCCPSSCTSSDSNDDDDKDDGEDNHGDDYGSNGDDNDGDVQR